MAKNIFSILAMSSPTTQAPLLAFTESQMVKFVRAQHWPDYRATQIMRWLYQRRVRTITDMTDLPLHTRSLLAQSTNVGRSHNPTVISSQDGTRKVLFNLDDGMTIESVLIPDDERLTLCVSTQVGCQLDCSFCLTGRMGLKRNLKLHEIIDQVLTAQELLNADERMTNLVFMGMGEPLANLDMLKAAVVGLTNKPWGLGWSRRRITVSTAGLASRLHEVAGLGVNLAVSLNATTEEQRRELMPAASELATLKALLAACHRYPLASHQRLTFEYVLLAGVNDQPSDARRLVQLLKGIRCKANLIPFNDFPGSRFRRPSEQSVLQFQSVLRNAGLDTFVRKSRGRDVLGACGQLGNLPAGRLLQP
ncbi:MAG: 23S rRNA (adenine(2503)-C(2))-methyltransferase RlmN [Nitrospira sp.]|nr:23S rRNA (adenine(2503)-C(2))-methyltransferase RlmN [Nitrospira sp.]MDH4368426.1 23S rRNA (adenine(2503)-C(2))-methyltransferase RlmN [Nitrospira sp.]MDH5346317.1 23S rRNA (adenine(2503)-C(2))-methyltransferase RlmN [Nitrospira sp.]MDH5497728.1 23S rRNA (adenine(2503)-C(2))-methyltransferase RlmN [Nitrospira sp.]